MQPDERAEIWEAAFLAGRAQTLQLYSQGVGVRRIRATPAPAIDDPRWGLGPMLTAKNVAELRALDAQEGAGERDR
jgi:hypothetical protein